MAAFAQPLSRYQKGVLSLAEAVAPWVVCPRGGYFGAGDRILHRAWKELTLCPGAASAGRRPRIRPTFYRSMGDGPRATSQWRVTRRENGSARSENDSAR